MILVKFKIRRYLKKNIDVSNLEIKEYFLGYNLRNNS